MYFFCTSIELATGVPGEDAVSRMASSFNRETQSQGQAWQGWG